MNRLHLLAATRTRIEGSRTVIDTVEAFQLLRKCLPIKQIQLCALDVKPLQAQTRGARTHGTDDLIASLEEMTNDVGTDKAGASGD